MDASSILLITVVLFYMNWRLAFVSILIFPIYVILNKFFKKYIDDIVFDTGRILEQGHHKELVTKRHGVYRRLYEEQFKNLFRE